MLPEERVAKASCGQLKAAISQSELFINRIVDQDDPSGWVKEAAIHCEERMISLCKSELGRRREL